MNEKYLNFGGIACLLLGVYAMYCMLLDDNTLPCSISSVEVTLSHLIKHWRVIIVAIMPIYVAFTLFGAAIGGLLFGATLQKWLTHFVVRKME